MTVAGKLLTVGRQIARHWIFAAIGVGIAFGIAWLTGLPFHVAYFAGGLTGVAVSGVTTNPFWEDILRRITGRPRMTPEAYQQLRRLEAELWPELVTCTTPRSRGAVEISETECRALEAAGPAKPLAEWTVSEYTAALIAAGAAKRLAEEFEAAHRQRMAVVEKLHG